MHLPSSSTLCSYKHKSMNTAWPLHNHVAERQYSQIWESGSDLILLCWTGINIIGNMVGETRVPALLLCIMSPSVDFRTLDIFNRLAIDIFECHVTNFTTSVSFCISKRFAFTRGNSHVWLSHQTDILGKWWDTTVKSDLRPVQHITS